MERTGYLLKAWYDGTISPAEEAELAAVLASGKQEAAVHAALQSLWAQHHGQEAFPAAVSEELYQKIRPRQQAAPGVHFMRRFRWVAAAVFILIAGATGWLLLHQGTEQAQITGSIYRNDVAPGKVGATLKLSDNRVIQLDSVADGVIAVEHGMKVIKRNGEIFYEGKAANSEAVIYNELIAAKKQRSSATLPDGSIAWVNASSSVRYPVHFTGNERRVTMTGEAIFKVAHNEKQPFRVYARGQVFEDLGTEFNINAYDEEPVIRTTVLEGLVQTGSTRIAPGQQAQVAANGQVKLNTQVNIDEVFAWRDGQFSFSGADIEEIMKQTARWYDVEVEFTAKINQQFTIGLNRDKTLTEFLQALEQAGHVHFEVQGRKVTVKP
jgi:ferric-dicitrate binding protein FerR (iron transport regulator)